MLHISSYLNLHQQLLEFVKIELINLQVSSRLHAPEMVYSSNSELESIQSVNFLTEKKKLATDRVSSHGMDSVFGDRVAWHPRPVAESPSHDIIHSRWFPVCLRSRASDRHSFTDSLGACICNPTSCILQPTFQSRRRTQIQQRPPNELQSANYSYHNRRMLGGCK